jgi:Phosphohistidine phosphatase SixA
MNTNIFLIRHGHSIYSPDELNRPLSERGIDESRQDIRLMVKAL